MTFFGKKNTFGDPKPEKKEKVLKKYVYKPKATGEKELFIEIWNERPHFCQVCGVAIVNASPTNFMHVIPKAQNKYPKFKLNKQNIILGCEHCHWEWDFQRHLLVPLKGQEKWGHIFELEESLKEQYKKL